MMPLKRIALDGVDAVVKLALERVWEWTEQFGSKRMPWLDGVIVGPFVTVGAGNVTLDHKLGRVPRGFIVIGYEGPTADAHPSIVSKTNLQIVVNFGGSSTATLWVWG